MSLLEHSRDPVYEAPNHEIRQYRQRDCHNEGLTRVEPVQEIDLINRVNENSDDEDLSDVLPAIANPFSAIYRIREEAPEIYPLACPEVPQPRANCKNRGNARLKNDSGGQRPIHAAKQVLQTALDVLFHSVLLKLSSRIRLLGSKNRKWPDVLSCAMPAIGVTLAGMVAGGRRGLETPASTSLH